MNLSSLTRAANFTPVIDAILLIAALTVAVYVVFKATKMIVQAIRGI